MAFTRVLMPYDDRFQVSYMNWPHKKYYVHIVIAIYIYSYVVAGLHAFTHAYF